MQTNAMHPTEILMDILVTMNSYLGTEIISSELPYFKATYVSNFGIHTLSFIGYIRILETS